MNKLRVLLDWVYLVCAWLSGSLLVALCGLILWGILARQLGVFSSGTSEFAGYFMAASTFLALAYTFRTDGHIRVALLLNQVSGTWLNSMCLAVMSGMAAYLAYYLVMLTVDAWEFEERSEGADAILLWIPQSVVAFGACMFAMSIFQTFIEKTCSLSESNIYGKESLTETEI